MANPFNGSRVHVLSGWDLCRMMFPGEVADMIHTLQSSRTFHFCRFVSREDVEKAERLGHFTNDHFFDDTDLKRGHAKGIRHSALARAHVLA